MNYPLQIAKHIREIHSGGNWTSANVQEQLAGITWQQANKRVFNFNSIAALVYHMNYYVVAISQVLRGKALSSKDELSFDHPQITSKETWEKLIRKTLTDAENLATLVEQLPENKLAENFSQPKYGSYDRNLHGVIEHLHYHLGQVVLIKKIILQEPAPLN
ncbi:MAG: DUF1572 domain-containing protein [Ferruginibacter sp.]|nr:DUF1572 domain-containing protein [Ferruginibacter sp.]